MIYLEDLVKSKKALSIKQVRDVQKWLDADWEANDINGDAVRLIQRLVKTILDTTVYGKI